MHLSLTSMGKNVIFPSETHPSPSVAQGSSCLTNTSQKDTALTERCRDIRHYPKGPLLNRFAKHCSMFRYARHQESIATHIQDALLRVEKTIRLLCCYFKVFICRKRLTEINSCVSIFKDDPSKGYQGANPWVLFPSSRNKWIAGS